MTAPQVSIIIATYGREAILVQTVKALLPFVDERAELIVIDQTPRHEATTEAFIDKLAGADRIRWIREGVPNLPRARNIGAALARGEFLLYLDDDVTPVADPVAAIIDIYKQTEYDALGGMILYPGEAPTDRPSLPISAERAAERIDIQLMRYSTPVDGVRHVAGACLSVRAAVLNAVGGFSHHFDGSALGEDLQFIGRLLRSGYRTRFDPRLAIVHHVAPAGGCRDATIAEWARSHGRTTNLYYAMASSTRLAEFLGLVRQRWLPLRLPGNAPPPSAGIPRRRTALARLASVAGRTTGAVSGLVRAWKHRRHPAGDLEAATRLVAASTSELALSIVIPSYRRGAVLLQTVRELMPLMTEECELIIVDQTPREEIEDRASLDDLMRCPGIRYIHEAEPGASRARNIGIRAARGRVVLFLDDDVTPSPDLLVRHLEGYGEPRVSAVGGRIVWTSTELEAEAPFPHDANAAARWPEAPVCYHTTPFGEALHVITCNLSVRRDRLMEVGGFNEWFTGYGEDIELVARLRRAGGRVVYTPAAAVIHHAAATGGTRGRREGAYAFGRRRGEALHYSVLLAVGLRGWLAFCGRRSMRFAARLLGRRARAVAAPPGFAGPVAKRLRARRPLPMRLVSAVVYKSAQLAGVMVGASCALVRWAGDPAPPGSIRDV